VVVVVGAELVVSVVGVAGTVVEVVVGPVAIVGPVAVVGTGAYEVPGAG
jgi:hypothetical protein